MNCNLLMEDCDETVYPPLENVPKRFVIPRRNEWISTVAEDDPLRSPASNGQIADVNWLTRFTKQQAVQIRNEMLHTTRDDLLALLDVLKAFAAKGTVCVVGHPGTIDECEDMTPMEI